MEPDRLSCATLSWQPGDRLKLRGHHWTVVQRTTYADCETLRVDSVAPARSQTFLLPFDRPRRLEQKRLTIVSRNAWFHALQRLRLDACPYGGLRHHPLAIDIVPYQLEPALAMLRDGHPRLLIADDVGMGKTIEAGIIVRELSERHDGFRALILVPAGLRQQWVDELAAHFHLAAVMADAGWLRSIAGWLPADVNPWSQPGTYVASFDFVKRPEALRPLEDVRWDLLVVDEAHAATIATDRRTAVDAIASRACRVVLLTGTPPIEPSQFTALCRIGQTPGGPDSVLFRRNRRTTSTGSRRSVLLAARTSDNERRMHRMLERYTTLVWREAKSQGLAGGRLATIVLRKRALSSAASLAVSLRRRQDLLAGVCPPPELQLRLPLSDTEEDAREDVVSDDLLGSSGFSDLAREQRWLSAVLTAASAAASQESKVRILVRLLTRIRQAAIVFTEYRDTLEQLHQVLIKSDLPTCVLHGGLSDGERRQALADFARGGRTLLATDAAAEGLNLQRACRVIVHYELPWNPSRMLQRAGRVDRLGQHRRVHEIALVASDTAESLVLAPLARKAIARLSPAGGARMLDLLTESRVAQAIFEGSHPDIPSAAAPLTACATVQMTVEAAAEAFRLERRRAMLSRTRMPSDSRTLAAVPVTTLRRSSLAPGLTLLFGLETAPLNGQNVELSLACVHVSVEWAAWPRRPAQIRRRLSDVLPGVLEAVAPTLDELGRRQLEALQPRYFQARQREAEREQAIQDVHDSAARQLVQTGLFDRRPLRLDTARQPAVADLLAQRQRRTDEPGALVSSANLRAVLLVLHQ